MGSDSACGLGAFLGGCSAVLAEVHRIHKAEFINAGPAYRTKGGGGTVFVEFVIHLFGGELGLPLGGLLVNPQEPLHREAKGGMMRDAQLTTQSADFGRAGE